MPNPGRFTYTVHIDWDYAGTGTADFTQANDNITAYVQAANINIGIGQPGDRMASVGSASIQVRNTDRRFSPAYAAGALYGKLLPNKPVRIQVTDGTTTWTAFRGRIKQIVPEPGGGTGTVGTRTCTIACVDLLDELQGNRLRLPLLYNKRADEIVQATINAAMDAPAATGTITFGTAAANNDTATVAGVTYTFKTTITNTNAREVLVGATAAACATNLAAAINGADGSGTLYASATLRHGTVTATVSGAVLTVRYELRGAVGNSVSMAKTGTAMTLSGAVLAGGADRPTLPVPSLQTGIETFDYSADTWSSDSTNTLTAIQDTVQSEQGYFWCARDGTLTFKNREFDAKIGTVATALTLDSHHNNADGEINSEDVFNYALVKYTPRALLTSGVIAKMPSPTQVPGQSGTERWTGTVKLPGGGNKVIALPFMDPTTKRQGAAQSVSLPLQPSVNWVANDAKDSSGADYTYWGGLKFSIAMNATSAEVSVQNPALGPLWITKLEIQGTMLVRYDAIQALAEDASSQALYGIRQISVDLPLVTSQQYAESLAYALVNMYKFPQFRVRTVGFEGQSAVGGVNLFGLEIGSIVSFTDYQYGGTAKRYWITGVQYGFGPPTALGTTAQPSGTRGNISFALQAVDDQAAWILDDPVYGVLDSTTRLGI